MSTGLASRTAIITAEIAAIASHTVHHDPGPKTCSMKGASRPEAKMPKPGPA